MGSAPTQEQHIVGVLLGAIYGYTIYVNHSTGTEWGQNPKFRG